MASKKQRLPLTELAFAALRLGPGTTDAIARRVRRPSRAVGKALSALKQQSKAHFAVKNGEAVWKRGRGLRALFKS